MSQLQETIDQLKADAAIFDQLAEPGSADLGEKYRYGGKALELFRDTLISIANCEHGLASTQAQNILDEAGLCGHVGSVYRAATADTMGIHICHNCGVTGRKLLVPYRGGE